MKESKKEVDMVETFNIHPDPPFQIRLVIVSY